MIMGVGAQCASPVMLQAFVNKNPFFSLEYDSLKVKIDLLDCEVAEKCIFHTLYVTAPWST